jgi:hypothetical protein
MDVEGTVWMVWVAGGSGLKPAPASVFILYGRGMLSRVCGGEVPGVKGSG